MSAPAGPASAAGDVRIDRLSLRVAGLDEDAARELARLVAQNLAPGMSPLAGTSAIESLQVRVQAAAGKGDPGALADQIAAEIRRALARGRPGQEGQAGP